MEFDFGMDFIDEQEDLLFDVIRESAEAVLPQYPEIYEIYKKTVETDDFAVVKVDTGTAEEYDEFSGRELHLQEREPDEEVYEFFLKSRSTNVIFCTAVFTEGGLEDFVKRYKKASASDLDEGESGANRLEGEESAEEDERLDEVGPEEDESRIFEILFCGSDNLDDWKDGIEDVDEDRDIQEAE